MVSNTNWTTHFIDMVQGRVPYARRVYSLKAQVGNGDIQMVTPTQAVVEQAKLDLKRRLQDVDLYKPKRITAQSGSGFKKRRKPRKQKKHKLRKSVKTSKNKKTARRKKAGICEDTSKALHSSNSFNDV